MTCNRECQPVPSRSARSPGRAEARPFAEKLLKKGFAGVLARVRTAHPQFSFADFSQVPDTQAESFWYDEIHPTEEGFGVLAARFNQSIRAALPASKRASVRVSPGV